MKQANSADALLATVTSGKMSQRGAAAKYGVDHSTLSRRIKRVANATPTETQASTEDSVRSQLVVIDRTLQRHLKQVAEIGHPTETQASAEVSVRS